MGSLLSRVVRSTEFPYTGSDFAEDFTTVVIQEITNRSSPENFVCIEDRGHRDLNRYCQMT